MPYTEEFASKVLQNIQILATTGKNYRRVNHKLENIKNYYIESMKTKFTQLGTHYLDIMTNNINTIFNKIMEKQNYESLEFINNIINWYFKHLAYKYKLTKTQPQLPDYIIAEISDIAKSLHNTNTITP